MTSSPRQRARVPAGRRTLAAAVLAAVLLASPSPATAQLPDIPQDLYEDRRRLQGDRIRFCVNVDAMLAPFEEALAREIARSLLVEVAVVPVNPLLPAPRYDFSLLLTSDELFIVLLEDCDAFMGFTLAESGYPDWLAVSRPYLETATVMAAIDPAIRTLDDIPPGRAVASRALSAADASWATFLQALPEERRWRRLVYPDNALVLARLADGTAAAALIWQPALAAAAEAGTRAHALDGLPFALPVVRFGIATFAEDGFLRMTLDQAIAALASDGTLARLLAGHGLPAAAADAGP